MQNKNSFIMQKMFLFTLKIQWLSY